MTKAQMRKRKEWFLQTYSVKIMEKYNARVYPHFIKIDIAGQEYDYYPGKGSLNKVLGPRSNQWSSIEPEEFLKLINIQ
jgi:hypothetical protein